MASNHKNDGPKLNDSMPSSPLFFFLIKCIQARQSWGSQDGDLGGSASMCVFHWVAGHCVSKGMTEGSRL